MLVLDAWSPRPLVTASVGLGLLGIGVGLVYLSLYDPSLDTSRIAIPMTMDEQSVASLSLHSQEHTIVIKQRPRRSVQLFWQTWTPPSGVEVAKGVVILVHGLNEHSSNMLQLVQALLDENFVVYAYDHEGFGRSSGLHALVYDHESLVEDLHQHIKTVHEKWPTKKRFVLGGSLGGALILHRLLRDSGDVDGVIVQCPALEIHANRQPPAIVQAIGQAVAHVAPFLALMPSNGGKGSSACVREQIQKMKMQDALYYTGKMRLGTAFQVKQCVEALQKKLALQRSLPVPLLLQHGTADVICSIQGSRAWFDRIEDCPEKVFRTYEDAGHDLLHEPMANQVVDDVVLWLKQHC
ncbi:hypothetical protein H310_01316 [Aphanomyces invadans]|uniref:Serine aminopeptidase S33 domain-containing protein n=1 Tax=Aphanomyces invadans TaxID=157072 RepID=A0A024URJ7_9STRA|nr:hypothetical protein H310_01316 [Aphanomyces invadans]ETW08805.1 hypothetical protein H310_01316 [Aphanomyces invadans]|eukprot:XP_008862610.1 hypothetical protein H310_01316 [Aphanomyces invadans]